MPRSVIPRYGLHRPSGQARVILDGQHVYLGPHGSPESRERYAQLIAERFASGRGHAGDATGARPPQSAGLTISQLLVAYLQHAQVYYSRDGQPSKEYGSMCEVARTLRELYGSTPAAEFGPRRLKALREHMIHVQDLSRKVINARINRIRRIFKWGVSEELVPSSVIEGLRTVDGLRAGRTPARETQPVRPVADEDIEQILPHVAPQVAAMVRLQRLTGMRPNEVVQLRPGDLDRTGDVWTYEPARHKTQWHGHTRRIPLGPRAQAVLAPFLEDRPPELWCFSPVEAECWRYAHRPPYAERERTAKVYPSELRRRAAAKSKRSRGAGTRAKRLCYDVDSYRRAIVYGIERARRAGVAVNAWSPHQLRHTRATEIRRNHGLEAAQVSLGHVHADVTEIYAERDYERAATLAREEG